MVLQIEVKNNSNVKVVLQVAIACESNIYSPINLWKTACLEPDTSLYFWPLNWKTPKQQLYKKSHSEIIGEQEWTVQLAFSFTHAVHLIMNP